MFHVSDENFKKQVLRQLQIINLRQQQMSEDIGVLLMKLKSEKDILNVSDEKCIFKNFSFPFKSEEELVAFEEFLVQENNFKNFVSKCTLYNFLLLL